MLIYSSEKDPVLCAMWASKQVTAYFLQHEFPALDQAGYITVLNKCTRQLSINAT
jgi:REP element-mobilizing transposase RayT